MPAPVWGDLGVHRHAPAMLMALSPWHGIEEVVGAGSCRGECVLFGCRWIDGALALMQGRERERAQALSQPACELALVQSVSDAFQVGTTLVRGNMAIPLQQADARLRTAVVGSALLTPDVASS